MDLPDEEEEHQETRLPGDETEAEAALRHISAHDRDHWIRCGHVLKHEFAEAGYEIWLLGQKREATNTLVKMTAEKSGTALNRMAKSE